MDNYKAKLKAQVSLEFVITFVMVVLFAVLVTKMFAWFGTRMVNRQKAYEDTRTMRTSDARTRAEFFTESTGKNNMDIFNENH
jgi:uncharacterized protein (UPF0333 family)